mgnify:CR=1 FL=1
MFAEFKDDYFRYYGSVEKVVVTRRSGTGRRQNPSAS